LVLLLRSLRCRWCRCWCLSSCYLILATCSLASGVASCRLSGAGALLPGASSTTGSLKPTSTQHAIRNTEHSSMRLLVASAACGLLRSRAPARQGRAGNKPPPCCWRAGATRPSLSLVANPVENPPGPRPRYAKCVPLCAADPPPLNPTPPSWLANAAARCGVLGCSRVGRCGKAGIASPCQEPEPRASFLHRVPRGQGGGLQLPWERQGGLQLPWERQALLGPCNQGGFQRGGKVEVQ
jgi:hypothetical protein